MTRGRDSFRLSPGLLALALCLKYCGLIAYGVHAVLVEVPSFVIVGGEAFALLWAVGVVVLSVVALAALARSWFTGKTNFERFATFAFVLTLLIYSIVLLVRAYLTDSPASASLAWLPAVLVILPTIRYYSIVGRK